MSILIELLPLLADHDTDSDVGINNNNIQKQLVLLKINALE